MHVSFLSIPSSQRLRPVRLDCAPLNAVAVSSQGSPFPLITFLSRFNTHLTLDVVPSSLQLVAARSISSNPLRSRTSLLGEHADIVRHQGNVCQAAGVRMGAAQLSCDIGRRLIFVLVWLLD